MLNNAPSTKVDLKAKVLELLGENRVMSIATVRPDGWPQATLVGYVHDDLTLYFAVARISQKFANIKLEPRVSIALGHEAANRLQGLSMGARAAEVFDAAEIRHLSTLIRRRYPGQDIFSPREASSAVMRATPVVISMIDLAKGPGEPELVQVDTQAMVHRIKNVAADSASKDQEVEVRYVHRTGPTYRADAPF